MREVVQTANKTWLMGFIIPEEVTLQLALPSEEVAALRRGLHVCAVTTTGEGVRCRRADRKGTWTAQALLECREACLGCPGCRYISYQLADRDCSWFRRCPELKQLGSQHVTHQVRRRNGSVLPPPPLSGRALRQHQAGARACRTRPCPGTRCACARATCAAAASPRPPPRAACPVGETKKKKYH